MDMLFEQKLGNSGEKNMQGSILALANLLNAS